MNRFLTGVSVAALFAMATEGGGGGNKGGAQADDAKRVKRYEATAFTRADLRNGKRLEDLVKAGRVTQFVIEHSDYKTAWELARTACRLGKLPKGDGEFTEVEPGSLTVKKVMTLDKNVKSNVLSAVEFIRIAEAAGVTISQKLRDFYEETVPQAQREAIEAELDAEEAAQAEADEVEGKAA